MKTVILSLLVIALALAAVYFIPLLNTLTSSIIVLTGVLVAVSLVVKNKKTGEQK